MGISNNFNSNYYNFGNISQIDYNSFDPHENLSTNIIGVLEKEVEKLKRESDNFKKTNKQNKKKEEKNREIYEEKVMNDYLSKKEDRMQMLKHVQTQNKPEYLSLEELAKLKEEHSKNLMQIENKYYQYKKKAENQANDYENFINREENKKITLAEVNAILKNEEDYFDKDFKAMNNNPKGKKGALDYDKNGKIIKRKFDTGGKRAQSSKNIKRYNEKDLDKPLDRNEEAYLKKYMNFIVKKKTQKFQDDENILSTENKYNINNNNKSKSKSKERDDWNKTKILSKNFHGGVDRKDNLSGHLYNDDYSFYYLSVNSENTPKSLSLKSFSGSKGKGNKLNVNRKINKNHLKKNYNIYDDLITKTQSQIYSPIHMHTENSAINNYNNKTKFKNKNNNNNNEDDNSRISNNNNTNMIKNFNATKNSRNNLGNNNNNNLSNNNIKNMNSHLAFGKLIFKLLDKEKNGFVLKSDFLREMDLDEQILNDLGFFTEENLMECLKIFKSEKEDFLNEQEFIALLLSRSELNEEYLENYRNNNEEGNMLEENNYDFDNNNNNYHNNNNNNQENENINYDQTRQFESKLNL
jgi:hypothetical protein